MAGEGVAAPGPEMARVRDTLVRPGGAARIHDIGGRVYSFGYGEHVEIPLDVARTIAHIPEFEVLHPNGARVVADTTQAIADGPTTVALRSDQVIASIDELSPEALRRRARLAGYGGDTKDAGAMSAFLMRHAADAAAVAAQRIGRKRKLLVNGVVTEVDLDRPGRVGHEAGDPDVGYIVDSVDTTALLMAQQSARGTQDFRPRA
jgi:hypothetical protein